MADDVVFNIAGDSSGAVTSISDVLKAAQDLDDLLAQIQASVQLVQDGLAKFSSASFGTLTTDTAEIDKSMTALAVSAKAASDAFDAMQAPISSIAAVMATLSADTDTVAKAMAALGLASDDAAKSLADAGTSGEAIATALDAMDASGTAAALSLIDVEKAAADAAVALADEATAASAAATAHDGLATASAASATAVGASAAAAGGVGVAEEEATLATAGHTKAGNDNGMMLMMLVPLLLQGASGFIKQGASAEDAISKIKGLADQSLTLKQNQGELDTVINTLQTDSVKYGVSMTDAANGLYYVKSAGFDTKGSMEILNESMKTAAGTGADMTQISNGLTSVIHAYGLKANDAASVTNKMATAVVQGKQDFNEFAKVIGRTADAGHLAGISFDEVLTAEATLTQINPSVQRDTQHLANLFLVLSDNADKTAAAAKDLGLKFDETKYKSMDLYDKLNYIKTVTHGNNQEMQKLFLNATAASAGFDLLSNNGETYRNIMGHVKNDTDSLAIAFQEAQKTMSFSWKQIQADISVVSYQLVAMIGPIIGPVLKEFASMLGQVAMNANALKPIFIGLAVAIGVLVFGALGALVGLMAESVSIFVVMGVAVGGLITAMLLLVPKFNEAAKSVGPLGREIRALEAQFKAARDYIQKEWNGVMVALGPIMKDFATIIKQNVIPALEAFGGGVGQAIINIMHHIGDALKALIPHLHDFHSWLRDKVIPALKEMQPAINAAAATLGRMSPILLALLPGVIGIALNFGKLEIAGGLAAKGVSLAGDAFKTLSNIANGILPFLKSIGPFFAALKGPIDIAVKAVWDFTGAIGPFFKGAIAGVGNALNGLKTIFGASLGPMDLLKNLWIALGDALGPLAEAITGVAGSVAGIVVIIGVLVAATVAWFTQTKEGQAMLKLLWEEVQKLGGVIMSALQPAWVALQQAMKDLAPLWDQLVEALKPLYPALLAIGGVIGGILVISLGVLIGVIAGVITGLGQFLAGCIRIVSGIIQVFTGLVQFFSGFLEAIWGLLTGNWKLWDTGWSNMSKGVQNIVKGMWQAIQGICQAFIGTIVGLVSGFVKTTVGFFQHLADTVVHHSIVPDMWQAIHDNTKTSTQKIQTTNQQFTDKMQSQFEQFGTKAPATMNTTWQKIQSDQKTSNSAMNANQTQAFQQMQTTTQTGMQAMGQQVQTGFTQMNTTATTNLNTMNTNVKQKFDAMAKVVTDDFAKMQQSSDKFWKTFNDNINGNLAKAVKAVQDGFDKMAKTVASDLQSISDNNNKAWLNVQNTCVKTLDYIVRINTMSWQNMLESVKVFGIAMGYANDDTWKQIEDGTKSGADKVQGTVKDLGSKLQQVFEDLDKQAKTWGEDLIKNFIDGMKSQQGALGQAANSAAMTVKGPLGFSLPSEGPLRDADTYMPDMMQLLAKGIHDNVGLVKNAAYQAAQAVQTSAPTVINMPTGTVSQVSKEHIDVLREILQAIKDQKNQGQQGSAGQTSIGYPIPSTTLGSINQQFGQNGVGGSGPNMIAGIYTQINQLAGLSAEYAKRGAATGVGF